MTPRQFEKLKLEPGAHIIVTWLDAAEIRTRSFRPLTEDDAITVVETEGQFAGIYTSPFYPELPHLIIYAGVRSEDSYHVHYSIPLCLVHRIHVVKRGMIATKSEPRLYVVSISDGEKRIVHEKHD